MTFFKPVILNYRVNLWFVEHRSSDRVNHSQCSDGVVLRSLKLYITGIWCHCWGRYDHIWIDWI